MPSMHWPLDFSVAVEPPCSRRRTMALRLCRPHCRLHTSHDFSFPHDPSARNRSCTIYRPPPRRHHRETAPSLTPSVALTRIQEI
ncbi:hypothetical protein AAHA92_18308 [Salvia divinorum]|uniref:Uncharacterized protein n=1 Tax=Salvia divinorum TaxID=28513 RepID=A0ABD1H5Q9_SALDI